ncbi:MAG: helix-turn-helix transcriptional regulator [Rivularia sp. (in: Bacteria)]|nr:helix-turn-helix transcriptional regulator [Rivularia sp. MS3]
MSQSKSISTNQNLETIFPNLECKPQFSTKKLCEQGAYLNSYCHQTYELPLDCRERLLVQIFLCDGEVERTLGDSSQLEVICKGDVAIIPDNVNHRAVWRQEIEFLLLAIERKLIDDIAKKIGIVEPVTILPHFARTDVLLHGMGLSLLHECQQWDTCLTYTNSMLQTTVIHLLRKYSDIRANIDEETINEQTEYKLKQALRYIDGNLDRHLPLEEVANKVNVSKYYFCRLFSQYVGTSPYRYLLQRRIDKAKILIQQNPDLKMADIALECGFKSQSHFNRQFRNLTGTTPCNYRSNLN